MNLTEFREKGYLQEVNRQWFHPLGLALFTRIDDETGIDVGLGIEDMREAPEGVTYAAGSIDYAKTRYVAIENADRYDARMKALGQFIQPAHPAEKL